MPSSDVPPNPPRLTLVIDLKAKKITAGDTVRFTNSDTIAHQVVFKTVIGIT